MSPFPLNNHLYVKELLQIVEQGHDGIFGGSKPTDMDDVLWNMVRTCWEKDPSQQPSAPDVEQHLMEQRLD
jgi:hypothetical protein